MKKAFWKIYFHHFVQILFIKLKHQLPFFYKGLVCWLVVLGLSQYFSLYRAVSQRGIKIKDRREKLANKYSGSLPGAIEPSDYSVLKWVLFYEMVQGDLDEFIK